MAELTVDSPLGALTLREEGGALACVRWGRAEKSETTPLLARAAEQLEEYFAGARQSFDLPLAPGGSALENQVWDQMLAIPPGETRTYGDVARAIDSAPQAVGQACGSNPLPIVIPCHRIVAAEGLGGYSGKGGLETKEFLLRLEGWPRRGQLSLFEARPPV